MNRNLTNSKMLFEELKSALDLEDADENHSIALMVMEQFYGVALTDIVAGKNVERKDLSQIIARLNQQEPVQYVLEESQFFGRRFKVNSSVLIPRPETESLVREVVSRGFKAPAILDIGTGSGCIAITLALEIPRAKVLAIDVSQDALSTAKENAGHLKADVVFRRWDVLKQPMDQSFDVIVSNPPYIAEQERTRMKSNVVDFEPHQALFVPDDDPLIFYRAIALICRRSLRAGGVVVVEINERFGREVAGLFDGFENVRVIKDLDGKDRIVCALRN